MLVFYFGLSLFADMTNPVSGQFIYLSDKAVLLSSWSDGQPALETDKAYQGSVRVTTLESG